MSSRLSLAVGLLPLVLAVQAIVLFLRPGPRAYHMWTGLLALSLAGVAGLQLYAFSSGDLILSPEIGFVSAHGSRVWLLRALLVGYALSAVMIAQSGRALQTWTKPSLALLGSALAVGVVVAWMGVYPLGVADSPRVQVYAYDVFSPFMLLWVLFCLLEWLLVICGMRTFEARLWFASAAAMGGCALAVSLARSSASSSMTLLVRAQLGERFHVGDDWNQVAAACLVGSLWLSLSTIMKVLFPGFAANHRWLVRALLAVWLVCCIVLYASLESSLDELSTSNFVCLLSWGLVGAVVWMRIRRQRLLGGLRFLGTRGNWAVLSVLFSSITLILFSNVDIYFLAWLPPLLDMGLGSLASVIWVELVSEGPLLFAGASLGSVLWGESSVLRIASRWLTNKAEACWNQLRELQPKLGAPQSRIGLVVLVYCALTAWAFFDEFPRRGNTIIHAFDAHSADGKGSALGRRVADHVAIHVAQIVNQLCVEVRGRGRTREVSNASAAAEVPRVSRDTDLLADSCRSIAMQDDGMLASVQANAVQLGPVEVPLHFLWDIVASPARRLLWGSQIWGSVHELSSTRTTADAKVADPTPKTYELIGYSSTGLRWSKAGPDLDALTHELAFMIVSGDPAWSAAGLTRDWHAYESFLAGVSALRDYEMGGRVDPLRVRRAVEHLGNATRIDPGFAFAHYKFALALREDSQYERAVDELYRAVQRMSSFWQAHDLRAELLLKSGRYQRAGYFSPRFSVRRVARARQGWNAVLVGADPRLSPDEVMSAHLGLCELEAHVFSHWKIEQRYLSQSRESLLQETEQAHNATSPHTAESRQQLQLLEDRLANVDRKIMASEGRAQQVSVGAVSAVHHCKTAAALTRRVLAQDTRTPEMAENRAQSLSSLADLMILFGRDAPIPPEHRTDVVKAQGSGPKADVADRQFASGCDAYRYTEDESVLKWRIPDSKGYELAAELLRSAQAERPDDPYLNCSLAEAEALSSGDDSRLGVYLESREGSTQLCLGLLQRARDERRTALYRAGLAQCQEALEMDPANTDILNSMGYAFRVWNVQRRNLDLDDPIGSEPARDDLFAEWSVSALTSAQTAVRLSALRNTPSYLAMVESTLGEVLLSVGRPHEAIQPLLSALRRAENEWTNEIKYDLAEAYLCAAKADQQERRQAPCSHATEAAQQLLAEITGTEDGREDRPYSSSDTLDIDSLREHCATFDDAEAHSGGRDFYADLGHPR